MGENRMSKQTPKKEENNTTQKIIGRSSNEEIKNRHEAYCKLRKIYPTLSKGEFINKVTAYFIKNKIRIPTEQTINSDLKKCKIYFKNLKHIQLEPTNFHMLGNEIHKKLRQIRVSFHTYDFILFDAEKDSTKEYNPKKELSNRYEDKNDFLPDLGTNQIPSDTLFHLRIILKEKGLEEYIANIYDSNFISPKPFLYSETHDYCTIIVFEFKNYDEIMDNTFGIVENFICSPLHKK